jgi:hypothetical protein
MRTVPLVRLGSITGEMLARVTGTAMADGWSFA